jgi:superfamily II RNA helicase
MTGDGSVNRDAPILCCTAEILAKISLRHGEETPYDAVIMDEFHYYGDRDRGMAWQLPLLLLERATFLLMSATLGDTSRILSRLESRTGKPATLVTSSTRPVPLDYSYAQSTLLESVEQQLSRNRAPIYVVCFTQREAAELAQSLTSVKILDREAQQAVKAELKGFRFDSPYGQKVQRYITHGIGLHHAGLLPRYRLLVERLAQEGLLQVICGTDTLGVGLNLPLRTVLFTRLYKFDGQKSAILSVRAFHQIAGRAGRKGFDSEGHVVCQAPSHVVENLRREAKVAAGTMSAKKFRRESPAKGYVAYDEARFLALVDGQPEPMRSVFKLSHGMLLELLQRDPEDCGLGGGFGALYGIIENSHESPTKKEGLKLEATELLQSLVDVGLVTEDEPGELLGTRLRLSESTSERFSVWHSLSLYVLEVVESLELSEEGYALRVLSLVEAILENPKVILYAQARRERGQRIGELKAEGLDYHERMEAVEDISWPRPEEDFIYGTFNAFIDARPWVGGEVIRPKTIARELFEGWTSFTDYIRDLGLERSEGVLLRYLSQVYKTLVRSIPDAAKNEELHEVIAFLRATLSRADSSLVTEWERLLAGDDASGADLPESSRKIDISANDQTFRKRIRAELHQLVRALSREDWAEAAASVRPTAPPWDAPRFEAALSPFVSEYGRPEFNHRARLSDKTRVARDQEHLWTVEQILVDREDLSAWSIKAWVDLREDTAPEGLLIEIEAISV